MSEANLRRDSGIRSSGPDQVFTGGYGANDPYRYALDNGLGPLECDVVAYVTRHNRGEATGHKYGRRDLLAAIATLTRLAIEEYGAGYAEVDAVVAGMFERRGLVGRTEGAGQVKGMVRGEPARFILDSEEARHG